MKTRISEFLHETYDAYNNPEYIHPDPLETVLPVQDPLEREITALLASSLALGNVKAMLPAIRRVLSICMQPEPLVLQGNINDFKDLFHDFTYRFFSGNHLAYLCIAIQRVVESFGSIEACFTHCISRTQGECPSDYVSALALFSELLNRYGEGELGILIPSTGKNSACKRLMLFLRWMIRRDNVDQGHWSLESAPLIIPLDTHMLNIAKRLKFTGRKQASLTAAVEITGVFRQFAPEDPVKYDFPLTRLGIHPDLCLESVVSSYCDE